MQLQMEKERLLCSSQQAAPHMHTAALSSLHPAPQHHPVLPIDPRDLQRLLDMGFHPKAAAQVRWA